jgi:hypothetical protein
LNFEQDTFMFRSHRGGELALEGALHSVVSRVLLRSG